MTQTNKIPPQVLCPGVCDNCGHGVLVDATAMIEATRRVIEVGASELLVAATEAADAKAAGTSSSAELAVVLLEYREYICKVVDVLLRGPKP
jgi:hypothetical protein